GGGGGLLGDGGGWVGDVVLSGGYDADSGRVTMHKAYLGGHGVDYDGVASATGIRGTWTIFDSHTRQLDSRGPFHIWPVGSQTSEELAAAAEAGTPCAV